MKKSHEVMTVLVCVRWRELTRSFFHSTWYTFNLWLINNLRLISWQINRACCRWPSVVKLCFYVSQVILQSSSTSWRMTFMGKLFAHTCIYTSDLLVVLGTMQMCFFHSISLQLHSCKYSEQELNNCVGQPWLKSRSECKTLNKIVVASQPKVFS